MLKKLLLSLFSLSLLFSCSKDDIETIAEQQSGKVSFAFNNLSSAESSNKSAKNLVDPIPDAIFITIKNTDGDLVIENQRLSLVTFGSSYVTDNLELLVGNYEITIFKVVDVNNVVIYASPLAGSEKGKFVNNPLPIAFSVSNNETNTVSPEVIFVSETSTPEQFGFTSFSFTVVDITDPKLETQDLYLSVNAFINGKNEEVEATYVIEISSKDFLQEGEIYIDLVPLEIPKLSTEDDVLRLRVNYPNYETKEFFLKAEEVANYNNEDNAFEVYFGNDDTSPAPEDLTLIVKTFNKQFSNPVQGSYKVRIDSQNYATEERYGNDAENLLELPALEENQIVNLTVYNQVDFTGEYKVFNLTAKQIIEFGPNGLFIYFQQYEATRIINLKTYYNYPDYPDNPWQAADGSTYEIKIPTENYKFKGTAPMTISEITIPYFDKSEDAILKVIGNGQVKPQTIILNDTNIDQYDSPDFPLKIYFENN